MSIWTVAFFLALLIWSILYQQLIFLIYTVILAIYLAVGALKRGSTPVDPVQKLKAVTSNAPGQPNMLVSVEIDLENADNYLKEYNSRNPPFKVTYTHISVASLGVAFDKSQKAGKLAFGEFFPAKSVELVVIVDVEGKDIGALVAKDTQNKTPPEMAAFLNGKIKLMKANKMKAFNMQNKILGLFPSFLLKILLRIGVFMLYDLELTIPYLASNKNSASFGAVSNITESHITHVHSALVSFTKVEVIMVISAPQLRPVVHEGEIQVRKMNTINMTFDSRFVDIFDACELVDHVKDYWENKERFDELLKQ